MIRVHQPCTACGTDQCGYCGTANDPEIICDACMPIDDGEPMIVETES